MGARAENGPGVIVCAVGGEPWGNSVASSCRYYYVGIKTAYPEQWLVLDGVLVNLVLVRNLITSFSSLASCSTCITLLPSFSQGKPNRRRIPTRGRTEGAIE